VEEAGASNFFCVTKDNVLRTPALGAILDGVTRKSVLHLAEDKKVKISEEQLSLETVLNSKEAFCTGTGAVITPVGSITIGNKKTVLNNGEVGPFTAEMYKTLLDIQLERVEDHRGWLHYPFGK